MTKKDAAQLTVAISALVLSVVSLYLQRSKKVDFRAGIVNPTWSFQLPTEGPDLRSPQLTIEADVAFVNVGEAPVVVTETVLFATAYPPPNEPPDISKCSEGAIGGDHGTWDIPALAVPPGAVSAERVRFSPIRLMLIDYIPDRSTNTPVLVCVEYRLIVSSGEIQWVRRPVITLTGNTPTLPWPIQEVL